MGSLLYHSRYFRLDLATLLFEKFNAVGKYLTWFSYTVCANYKWSLLFWDGSPLPGVALSDVPHFWHYSTHVIILHRIFHTSVWGNELLKFEYRYIVWFVEQSLLIEKLVALLLSRKLILWSFTTDERESMCFWRIHLWVNLVGTRSSTILARALLYG